MTVPVERHQLPGVKTNQLPGSGDDDSVVSPRAHRLGDRGEIGPIERHVMYMHVNLLGSRFGLPRISVGRVFALALVIRPSRLQKRLLQPLHDGVVAELEELLA